MKKRKKQGMLILAIPAALAVIAALFLLIKWQRETKRQPETDTEKVILYQPKTDQEPAPETGPEQEVETETEFKYEIRETAEEQTQSDTERAQEEIGNSEAYLKYNKENFARVEFAQSFHPEITGFFQDDHNFPLDEAAVCYSAGWYLYSNFGEVEITQIRFDYFLAGWEEGIAYHVTFLEADGSETPLICTYYSNYIGSAYTFQLTDE